MAPKILIQLFSVFLAEERPSNLCPGGPGLATKALSPRVHKCFGVLTRVFQEGFHPVLAQPRFMLDRPHCSLTLRLMPVHHTAASRDRPVKIYDFRHL